MKWKNRPNSESDTCVIKTGKEIICFPSRCSAMREKTSDGVGVGGVVPGFREPVWNFPPQPQTEKVTFKSRWIHQHQRDVRRERQLKCRPCFYSSGLKALRANSLNWHLYFERCGSARENKTSSCQNQKRSGKFTPRFFFCWACFSLLKKAGLFFFFFFYIR